MEMGIKKCVAPEFKNPITPRLSREKAPKIAWNENRDYHTRAWQVTLYY